MRLPILLMILGLSLLQHQAAIAQRGTESLKKAVEKAGFSYGAPIFMRIFKQPAILEVWLENSEKKFVKFRTYPICAYSGSLGPKLKEGDQQAPEGFYFVTARQLNPHSSFHLSFNLGYPNAYDRAHGRTGSYLMVHGDCVSIGCYAMTDAGIEEIYALAEAALQGGQGFFRVHIFPFPLTDENLAAHTDSQWLSFWQNLQAGYEWFEQQRQPPEIAVRNGRYVLAPP